MRELMLLAWVRMGAITSEIPKGSRNQYTNASSRMHEKAQTKAQVVQELGFSKDQVSRMEQMVSKLDTKKPPIRENYSR